MCIECDRRLSSVAGVFTCVSFLKDLFWKIQTFFFQWLTHGQEEVERIVNVFQHKPMENMYNLEA